MVIEETGEVYWIRGSVKVDTEHEIVVVFQNNQGCIPCVCDANDMDGYGILQNESRGCDR